MNEITSVNNELIKGIAKLQQRKYRDASGKFLIEGLKGIKDAVEADIKIEYVFINKKSKIDVSFIDSEVIYYCVEPVLKKISTTDSTPEILAVAYQKKYSLSKMFEQKNPLIILLDGVKDPGNLGTIVRTAKACECSGIILTDNSVDLYNPKIVRSSVGNLWKIPVIQINEMQSIKEQINSIVKCQFFATVVQKNKKSSMFYDVDYQKPTVIMFGSEADGLRAELVELADNLITIPMNSEVESLNLSVSAGVILYESVRQRSCK